MYLKRILTYSILSLVALFGFFGNIHIETQDTQTSSIGISYEGNTTYASNDPATGFINTLDITPNTGAPEEKKTSSAATVKLYNDMIGTINIALAVLSAMISPIILFVGWLMSPDWTSGDIFGLRDPMYKLWVTVSNIVYFIYAILLILIALGTMFGQDRFSYKVMLPKLALGILMVPFTWWFVQWTISISSVVTASVMTIPYETIGANDSAWFTKPSIPTIIIVDNTGSGTKNAQADCSQVVTSGPGCLSPKDFLKKAGGMYGPLIVYGYSIFKFKEITEIKNGLDVANAAIQLVHTSIVSTIMFAVFGLLTLALATMLLVRAIKLWMYAIFAPLFTFRFVAGSNLMGGDDDSFTIKEFIGLAFVPAIVGLTLSFGLIMINAVQGPGISQSNTSKGQECDLTSGCVITSIMGDANNKITRKITEDVNNKNVKITSTTFAFGGLEFYFLGKATNQSDTKSTASGSISSLGGIFGTLIVDVIALVFIWMAFMAAKNVSKAVKMAVEPFEKIGSQVGSLAKSIPKYTPLPLPGGSIAGMQKASADLAHLPEAAANKRYEESTVGKFMKSHNDGPTAAEMEKLRGTILNDGKELRSVLQGASLEKFKQMYPKIEENKEKFQDKVFLDKIGLKDSHQQNKVMELTKKGSLDEKELAQLHAILTYGAKGDVSEGIAKEIIKAGKIAGTGGTAGANGTTSAATTGNGVISINGVTFNYNGIDLKETPTKIGEKIAAYLNVEKTEMEKPTPEQIKELVKSLGVDRLKEAETITKIVGELDSTGFKEKP